mmetsp:Transcript_20644/g.69275  ORF Transcript_20644/g.69275 Transcript_20644/m.69275 type:complete len:470 (-) Transcript_20644:396-1805(-)
MELLKDLHFFRKVPRDLTEATLAGGGLSLVSTFVMAYLFVTNIMQYLASDYATTIVLDRSVDHRLQINFNVTLPRLPCRFASVDVSDVMGTHLLNVSRNVQKLRIDADKVFLGEAEDRPRDLIFAAAETGDRAAAAAREGKHSSVLVKKVDDFRGVVTGNDLVLVNFYAPWCPWSQRLAPVWEEATDQLSHKPYARAVTMAKVDCTSPDTHDLCVKEHVHAFPTVRIYRDRHPHSQENYVGDRTHGSLLAFMEKNLPEGARDDGARPAPFWEQEDIEVHAGGPEGCIVQGALLVNRVPGNFHISAHSTSHSLHMPHLNLTHTVKHLSFGKALAYDQFAALPDEVARTWNPLHGVTFAPRVENVTMEHYLKVVHTSYEPTPRPSTHISTYQYTIHSHQYEDHEAYPAVVFSYDLSPIQVVVRRERESFAAFLTQICAIVGGVFTITGLIDSIIYHGDRMVRRKMEIGKAI